MSTRKKRTSEATMAGLSQWYKSAFERLGWMVLAKEYGMDDKLIAYKIELQRLHKHLCQKIDKVHDEDKKDDLKIMKTNVECLIAHANKDFK
jgi:hypothetical protein